MKNAMKSCQVLSRLMDTAGNFIAGYVKTNFDCRPAFRKPLADVTPGLSTTFMPYVERPILIIGLILTIVFWVQVVWFHWFGGSR